MFSGVDGSTRINIIENGIERVVNARSLFQKLNGKKKASNKSADKEEVIEVKTDKIKILTLNGDILEYHAMYRASCLHEGVFKLRGDRISVSASLYTIVYKEGVGFTGLDNIYAKDKIQYINQKNEIVYDWVTGLSALKYDDNAYFVYNFYTFTCNFIANRVVIGQVGNAE
jgi:hypothetical protein